MLLTECVIFRTLKIFFFNMWFIRTEPDGIRIVWKFALDSMGWARWNDFL